MEMKRSVSRPNGFSTDKILRLGGPKSRFGCSGEKKNLRFFQEPNPDSLVVQPIS
jgi:hypothetical protein